MTSPRPPHDPNSSAWSALAIAGLLHVAALSVAPLVPARMPQHPPVGALEPDTIAIEEEPAASKDTTPPRETEGAGDRAKAEPAPASASNAKSIAAAKPIAGAVEEHPESGVSEPVGPRPPNGPPASSNGGAY